MAFRGAIPDFQLANPLYIGASVTFFEVDESGEATATQATLYADPTGSTTALNPQTLDSEGKFEAPVYIEVPVIAEVVGATVGSHTTGVINARGTWRGDWATGETYYTTDMIRDPVTGNIYSASNDYVSGGSVTADVTAGNLELIIDQSELIAGGASLAIKVPVRVASTANITLSALQTIDGVSLAAGDRVLVKDQTSTAANGIYNAAAGAWTRAVDADTSSKFADGCVVNIREGTIGSGRRFQLSISTPFTLGTSAQTWVASEFPESVIEFTINAPPEGQLTTGIKGYSAPCPFPCTIDLMTLIANASCSMVVDIYKAAFPTVPSTGSICASAKPTLTAAQATSDSTLTGWTLTLARGDILALDIVSVSTGVKFFTLTLDVNRN